jgi:RimJ/RimL family protein N-acetyltransferase
MKGRSLDRADTEAIARWRYPGRYSTYDVGEIANPERMWAVTRDAELVGYCSVGPGARVSGVNAEAGTLDIGYGMRPDLVGQGLGPEFVATILDFAIDSFSPQRLRLLILSWNERSRKVAEALGFDYEATVASDEGDFLVLTQQSARCQQDSRRIRLRNGD